MRMALEFAKNGTAKYISHLDLQRAFSRSLRRSGLPVKLSAGFNPHYIVSFASALSVGIESECECVEMVLNQTLSPDAFLSRAAKALPPGIEARQAVVLQNDAPKLMAALKQADYSAQIIAGDIDAVQGSVSDIISSDIVMAVKKKGKEHKDINIRDMIISLAVSGQLINMRLSASQQANLRPDLLLQAIESKAGPLFVRIKRTGLYALVNEQSVPLLTAYTQ